MSHHKGDRIKFTLRMPSSFKRRLEAEAERAGVDLNTWINQQLEKEATSGERR